MEIDGAVTIAELDAQERNIAMLAGLHLGCGPRELRIGNAMNCENLQRLVDLPLREGETIPQDWRMVIQRGADGIERQVLELRSINGVPFALDNEHIGVFWKVGTLEEMEL